MVQVAQSALGETLDESLPPPTNHESTLVGGVWEIIETYWSKGCPM